MHLVQSSSILQTDTFIYLYRLLAQTDQFINAEPKPSRIET